MNSFPAVGRGAFLTGITAFAVVAGASTATAQTPPVKLRMGVTPSDGYGEAFYGHDAGFFSDAGIDLEITAFDGEAQILGAMIGGSLDVGIASPFAMSNAYLRGLPIAYIGAGSVYSSAVPTLALIVPKTSPIRQAKELEGQTIGVLGVKDSTHLATVAWLVRDGADVSRVKFIGLGRAEIVASVERGLIAAGMIGEPFLSAALGGSCRQFGKPFDVYGDHALIAGYVTTLESIKTNAPVLRRFIAAMYRTAKWANANQSKTGDILQKYTKITDETVKMMRRVSYAESLEPPMVQRQLDVAYQYKFIDSPVNAADIIRKV
jgi:NitT/TauT family transport system substrate-binding protein